MRIQTTSDEPSHATQPYLTSISQPWKMVESWLYLQRFCFDLGLAQFGSTASSHTSNPLLHQLLWHRWAICFSFICWSVKRHGVTTHEFQTDKHGVDFKAVQTVNNGSWYLTTVSRLLPLGVPWHWRCTPSPLATHFWTEAILCSLIAMCIISHTGRLLLSFKLLTYCFLSCQGKSL